MQPKSYQVNGVLVTEAWLKVITYCQKKVPYGDISLRIQDGKPTELLAAKAAVRFDKPWGSPEYPFPEPMTPDISR